MSRISRKHAAVVIPLIRWPGLGHDRLHLPVSVPVTSPSVHITRKQFAQQLLEHLRTPFLPRLAAGDLELLGWFQEHGCGVAHTGSHVSVTLELAHLFNALSSSAQAAGLEPPTPWDWSKQFKEFCDQLMDPWPTRMFEAAGLGIHPVHQSSSYARSRFEIFRVPPRKEAP